MIDAIAREELLALARVYRDESYRYHRAGQIATAASYTVRARVVSRIGTGEAVDEVLASEIQRPCVAYDWIIESEVANARSIIMRARDIRKTLPTDEDRHQKCKPTN